MQSNNMDWENLGMKNNLTKNTSATSHIWYFIVSSPSTDNSVRSSCYNSRALSEGNAEILNVSLQGGWGELPVIPFIVIL